MGDPIKSLPSDNEEINKEMKQLIEYLFHQKIEHTHSFDHNKYRMIIFISILFIVLSLPIIDEFLFSLFKDRTFAIVVKFVIFVVLLISIEKYV
jgi:hypothetical protein